MGGDDTLTTSAEQTYVANAEQERGSVENAQNVDDRSLRGENLQNLSNVVHGNDVNNQKICEDGVFHLRTRDISNSQVNDFCKRKFTSSYTLPKEYSYFKGSQKPFNVEYNPKKKELNIQMPVQFMPPTDLQTVNKNINNKERSERMSDDASQIQEAYSTAVNRVWSNKYPINLDAKNSGSSNGSCKDWSCIDHVSVHVSVVNSDNPSHKIYYYKNAPSDFRAVTGSNYVIFSEDTVRNRDADKPGHRGQNVFAHEFGHQIGFGDEYAVDYIKGVVRDAEISAYSDYILDNHKLKAYEQTERVDRYTLPRDKFNRNGKEYYAEEKVFAFDTSVVSANPQNPPTKILNEKNGVVLKSGFWGTEECERPKGLKSPDPISAVDINGKQHDAVYLFPHGTREVTLEFRQKPGVREYDLEELFEHRTDGARLNHNGKKYSVGKCKCNGQVYYYLVKEDGSINDRCLDGSYTSHTQMAADEFGKGYANKYAVMNNGAEYNRPGYERGKLLKDNLMNEGNSVLPHYYIPFKKAMVAAIRSDYWFWNEDEVPFKEEDWKIG